MSHSFLPTNLPLLNKHTISVGAQKVDGFAMRSIQTNLALKQKIENEGAYFEKHRLKSLDERQAE